MLKLLPILFLAVINTANVNIFEIEGIFSSGHINALERYVDENREKENNLFVVQYNASDVNVNSIDELQGNSKQHGCSKSNLGRTKQKRS